MSTHSQLCMYVYDNFVRFVCAAVKLVNIVVYVLKLGWANLFTVGPQLLRKLDRGFA